jgi:hypothetical protein
MAARPSTIRAALHHVLETGFQGQVQVATAPDQLTPPCLLVGQPTVRYHQNFGGGLGRTEWPIWGIMPRTADQSAVDQLDDWLAEDGPLSVQAMIERDQSLGGACQTLVVREAVPEMYPTASGEMPSYRWEVEVYG